MESCAREEGELSDDDCIIEFESIVDTRLNNVPKGIASNSSDIIVISDDVLEVALQQKGQKQDSIKQYEKRKSRRKNLNDGFRKDKKRVEKRDKYKVCADNSFQQTSRRYVNSPKSSRFQGQASGFMEKMRRKSIDEMDKIRKAQKQNVHLTRAGSFKESWENCLQDTFKVPDIPLPGSKSTKLCENEKLSVEKDPSNADSDIDDQEYADLLLEYSQVKKTLNELKEKERDSSKDICNDIESVEVDNVHRVKKVDDNDQISQFFSSVNEICPQEKTSKSEKTLYSSHSLEDLETLNVKSKNEEKRNELIGLNLADKMTGRVGESSIDEKKEEKLSQRNDVIINTLDKIEVVDMELASTDEDEKEKHVNCDENKQYFNDIDEDLELLELKKAALESAVSIESHKYKSNLYSNSIGSVSDTVLMPSKGKPRFSSRKRKKSGRLVSNELEWEKEKLKLEKEQLRRESEKLRRKEEEVWREKDLLRKERQQRHQDFLKEMEKMMNNKKSTEFRGYNDANIKRNWETLQTFDPQTSSVIQEQPMKEPLLFPTINSERNSFHNYDAFHQSFNPPEMNYGGYCPIPFLEHIEENRETSSFTTTTNGWNFVPHILHNDNFKGSNLYQVPEVANIIDNQYLNPVFDQSHRYTQDIDINNSEKIAANAHINLSTAQTTEIGNNVVASEDTEANKGTGNNDSDVDEEAELLRAQLLADVSQKRRKREENSLVNETDNSENIDDMRAKLIADISKKRHKVNEGNLPKVPCKQHTNLYHKRPDKVFPKRKILRKNLRIPKHKPVIINLGEDSSDDDDCNFRVEDSTKAPFDNGQSYHGTLDSFLKVARQSVENHNIETSKDNFPSIVVPPPSLIENLEPHKIEEYNMLQEKLKKRKQDNSKNASRKVFVEKEATNILVTVTDQNLKDDCKEEMENTIPDEMPKAVNISDKTAIEQQPTKTNISCDIEEPAKKVDEMTRVVKVNNTVNKKKVIVEKQNELEKAVKTLELKTLLQKKLIEQDQQQIKKLKTWANNTKSQIKVAEQKMQMLKEQMRSIQTSLKRDFSQILKWNEEAQDLQSQIGNRNVKYNSIKNEMFKLGTVVYGVDYKPSLPNIKKESFYSPPKRKIIKITKSVKVKNEVSVKHNKPQIPTAANKEMIEKKHEKQKLIDTERNLLQLIESYKEKRKTSNCDPNYAAANVKVGGNVNSPSNQSANYRTPVNKRRSWVTTLDTNNHTLQMKPEHVITEETMQVGKLEDSEEEELNVKGKSYLTEIQNFTKPNISEAMKLKVEENTLMNTECKVSSASTDTNFQLLVQNCCNKKWDILQNTTCQDNSFNKLQNFSPVSGLRYLSTFGCKHSSLQIPKKLKSYKSPLLRFKSYRFSPYFRTKFERKITSFSYSNRINSSAVMCRFDLNGKCNDENCLWQHQRDYLLQNEQVLQDLVSYAPQLAGVNDKTPYSQYQIYISHFVLLFSQKNSKMTEDEKCILLSSQINNKSKHIPPHTTRLSERKWKPGSILDKLKDQPHSPEKDLESSETRKCGKSSDFKYENEVLNEREVRYWRSTEELDDLEAATVKNPKNSDVWLKLAYRKLYQTSKEGKLAFDLALNVFSRALEVNKENSDLWYHYLSLYEKKGSKDLLLLYKQALLLAPTYQLHKMYIDHLESISDKIGHCEAVLKYLSTTNQESAISQKILEILLYHLQLLGLEQKEELAIKTLQNFLDNVDVVDKLSAKDLIVAWLVNLHLTTFYFLPKCVFDQTDHSPGRVVKIHPFIIDWERQSLQKNATSAYTNLNTLFQNAIASCSKKLTEEKEEPYFLLPLYKNRVLMHLHYYGNKSESIEAMCNEILEMFKKVPEAIIFVSEIFYSLNYFEKATGVIENGLLSLPYEASLINSMAHQNILSGKIDTALEILELSPFYYFSVDISNTENHDPNILFSVLLNQSIPLNTKTPEIKKEALACNVKCKTYLWLNYCLLLELQGFVSETYEKYETALSASTTKSLSEVRTIWKHYLVFAIKQLKEDKQNADISLKFWQLVRRCLVSVPCKFTNDNSNKKSWLDYSYHNEIVDLIMSILPTEEKLKAFEDLTKLMPSNVELIIKACRHLYKEGSATAALGMCTVGLEDCPKNILLYQMYFMLAAISGKENDARSMFLILQQCLPYSYKSLSYQR